MAHPRAATSLKDLRAQRGLSQEAVAVLGGCDKATISRIEKGLINPRPILIVRLAKGLGVSAKRMQGLLAAPPEEEQKELEGAGR